MVATPFAAKFPRAEDAPLRDDLRRPGGNGQRRFSAGFGGRRIGAWWPYGTLVAAFHTGLGCLLGPSLLFFATRGARSVSHEDCALLLSVSMIRHTA